MTRINPSASPKETYPVGSTVFMHETEACSALLDVEPLTSSVMNNTPIYGWASFLDSAIRGAGRHLETLMDSYILRITFRFITENIRYGSSRLLQDYLSKNTPDYKKIFMTGVNKSIEITTGAAIVDPNRQQSRLVRMGMGFLNAIARIAARFGMVKIGSLTGAKPGILQIGSLSKEQFNLRTLIDEFFCRTIFRVIHIVTENPIISTLCKTTEQFGINEWLRNLPFNNFILSKLKETLGLNNSANAAPA